MVAVVSVYMYNMYACVLVVNMYIQMYVRTVQMIPTYICIATYIQVVRMYAHMYCTEV